MPGQLASPGTNREPNTEIRAMLVDSILLLTSTKIGREKLREKKVYPILREYDKIEENEEIKNNLFSIVNVLVGLNENLKVNIDINPAEIIKEISHFTEKEEKNVVDEQKFPNKTESPIKKSPKPILMDSDEEGEKIEEI